MKTNKTNSQKQKKTKNHSKNNNKRQFKTPQDPFEFHHKQQQQQVQSWRQAPKNVLFDILFLFHKKQKNKKKNKKVSTMQRKRIADKSAQRFSF